MKPKFIANIFILLCFCLIISFPLLNTVFKFIPDTKSLENRKLNLQPAFNINNLDPYPFQVDSFYNDHFNLRNRFVNYFSSFKLKAFNKSSFPDRVFVGWDGWLFLKYNDLDAYQGKNNLSATEMENIRLELEYRQAVLDSMGCKFYFGIAPGKPNIYPEKMPYYMFRYSNKGWGEQFLEYLDKYKTISTLNLYDTLRKNKDKHQLYYKLDTHWNNWGAHYAVNAFVKKVMADKPGLLENIPDSFMVVETTSGNRNCAQMLGYPESIYEEDYLFIQKNLHATHVKDSLWQNPKKKKPRIVVMGDSFCFWFVPLVAEKFGTTIYSFNYRKYEFNKKQLLEWKPDIVLMLIHEPLLRKIEESSCRPKTGKESKRNN